MEHGTFIGLSLDSPKLCDSGAGQWSRPAGQCSAVAHHSKRKARRNRCVAFLLLIVPYTCFAYPDLPDPTVTPGATNPDVTQSNIAQTICVPGWTAKIRPPAAYTTKLKLSQLKSGPYRSDLGAAAFEEDHLISLEIGGNPNDEKNLWPQVWNPSDGNGAHKKDHLENTLKSLVCAGKIPLKEAQDAISSNWLSAFDKYVTNPPTSFSKRITH